MPKLRKGRDRCSATRRDGRPCQAPAVPHLLVCRRHGGGTPAAQIVSQYRDLQLRFYVAEREWFEARGSKDEDAALTRYGTAQSKLRYFEERLSRLWDLQAEVSRRKEAGTWPEMLTSDIPVLRLAKLQRQADERRRWKPRTQTDPMEASPYARGR